MQTFNLTLTLEEVNTLLEALGQMPYVRVYQLILKIQQQTAPQLSAPQPQGSAKRPENGVAETENKP